MRGVSVIIPLYNKKKTIFRTIRSVLDQHGVDTEIIVIDDGSTDNPEEVVYAFGDLVRFERQENAGPSAARNYGVRLSQYPILLFLDADDELLPGCLSNYLRLRRQVPGLQLTVGSFRVMVGDSVEREEILPQRLPNLDRVDGDFLANQFYSDLIINIASGTICVDRELFEQVGGFDEALWCWEITDLMYHLVLQTSCVGIAASVQLVVHENSANSQFEKAQKDLRYRTRFAHRLLDKMDSVPNTQRHILLCSVRNTLRSALYEGEFATVKILAERVRNYEEDIPEIKRLCQIGMLPPLLIRLLLVLRRVFRN